MLKKILRLGINTEYSESKNKRIVLSNELNLVVICLMVIEYIASYYFEVNKTGGYTFKNTISVTMISACFIHLILNSFGQINMTRILMLLDIPLIICFVNPLSHGVVNDQYFWLPYVPVAFSVASYYLFNERSDLKWIISILIFYFILVLFMDNILDFLSSNSLTIKPIVDENRLYYKLSASLIFIFVNLTLFQAIFQSRKYENELRIKNKELAEINSTKDKFFKIISHDLKGTVSQMIQFTEFMKLKYNELSEEKMLMFIEEMNESSTKGFKLLEDLIQWARSQTGIIKYTPENTDISKLINENIQLLSNQAECKNIEIITNFSYQKEIFADVNMLNTVIRNLLSNAIKFTYPYGKIEIKTTDSDNNLSVCIKDNGKGIDPESMDKLFKVESGKSTPGTNEESGTGIGLILCKEFIDKHNGRIWAESEPEKGSCFTFSIPQE